MEEIKRRMDSWPFHRHPSLSSSIFFFSTTARAKEEEDTRKRLRDQTSVPPLIKEATFGFLFAPLSFARANGKSKGLEEERMSQDWASGKDFERKIGPIFPPSTSPLPSCSSSGACKRKRRDNISSAWEDRVYLSCRIHQKIRRYQWRQEGNRGLDSCQREDVWVWKQLSVKSTEERIPF